MFYWIILPNSLTQQLLQPQPPVPPTARGRGLGGGLNSKTTHTTNTTKHGKPHAPHPQPGLKITRPCIAQPAHPCRAAFMATLARQANARYQVSASANHRRLHCGFHQHGKKLIIELDGGQHAEQADYDAARTAYLESEGYRVLRFWNNQVLQQTLDVLTEIERHCR